MQTSHLKRQGFAARYLTLFGGEAFSKVCVMAAFAYLARSLGPRDFGIVELALSLTVFFVLGVESGMGSYGARLVAARPEVVPTLVPQIMLLRALYGVPAYLLALGVASHYQVAGLGILAINGLTVLLTPFYLGWVFQGLRQMQWVAAGTALRNLVFVGLIVALVGPGSDIRLVALAEIGGATILALCNVVILLRRLHVRLEWRGAIGGTRTLFRDVWYLGASDLAWACLWYAPGIIVGWLALSEPEQVAWIAAAVRIVVAVHTFVWLYFFNLLPNLAKELSVSPDDWRHLVERSMSTSMWPACLIAVGGTLIAPLMIPLIYGEAYLAAVAPFQIVIWMIPVAWCSGHFRFSLLAAGLQRWEVAASAGTALVTVLAAWILAAVDGSRGAASALLLGGVVNAVLSLVAMRRFIGRVSLGSSLKPVIVASVAALAGGMFVSTVAGAFAGTAVATLAYLALAARENNELVVQARQWIGRLW